MDTVTLADTGRLLYGDEWQRALAKALGPLHPDGARDSIDDRLVRRWAAGDRPVPIWVDEALLKLLDKRAFAFMHRVNLIRERAAQIRSSLAPVADDGPEMRF